MELDKPDIVAGGSEKWLEYAEAVRGRYYKFANARPLVEQDKEDIFQEVVAYMCMNVDIDNAYDEEAAKNYLMRKLTGAVLDFCRSRDPLSRWSRSHINYIQSKIRNGKALADVLREENMTLQDWEKLQVPTPKSFELGKHDDILASNDLGSDNSFADFLVQRDSADVEEDDDQDYLFRERLVGSVTAFFETLEKRARVIMYCYYLGCKRALEIGQFLGVTESRICQIIGLIIFEKLEMHKVLQSLKDLPAGDNVANDARDILRESILAGISLESGDEENAALADFLARERKKRLDKDVLQVLKSVPSVSNKSKT